MEQRLGPLAALKGAILMTGSSYATYALGLLVGALIARQLAPDDYGRYAYVVWLSGVLVMAGNHGLPTTAIRFVAEALGLGAPGLARTVRDWLYRRQVASLLLLMVLFLVAVPTLLPAGWSSPTWIFVIVVVVSTVTKSLYLLEISVAKGQGRFGVEASASVFAGFASALAVLVLFHLDAGLHAYLALFTAICIVHLVIAAWLSRHGQPAAAPATMDADFDVRLRTHLVWTIVLTLAWAFGGTSIAVYLLNLLVGSAEVGFFVIAAALARGAIDLVASGLMSVLMPVMGHAFGAGGKARVGAIFCDSLRYLQFLGLLAAGLGCFWAEAVIILLYGEAYSASIPILRWMLLAAGIALGESAFGALLSTTDNQRLRATFAASYLAVSLLASVVLIPTYGLTGAVIACVGARLILYAIGMAVAVRLLAIRLPWRPLGKIVLAALLAAAASSPALSAWPGPAGGILAGIAYGLLFLLASRYLGVWQEKDVRMVLSLGSQYPRLLGWTRSYLDRWIAAFERQATTR
jgi:O-antigen/teichoic acid export membrane protein